MMNLAAVTDNRLEQRAMAGVMDGVRVLEVAAWVLSLRPGRCWPTSAPT